jgi:hypothetical protein
VEAFIKPPTDQHRPRYATALAALIVISLLGVVFFGFVIGRTSADQKQMEELASFVLATGEPTVVAANRLAYFVLPLENPQFYELQALSEGGGTKRIQVRLREDGTLDVFLLDLLSNGASSIYLSNDGGRLVQSAYFDDSIKPITDAQDNFERQLGFWNHWRDQKLTSL